MKRFEIGMPVGSAISTHCSINLPRPLLVAKRHVNGESIAITTPSDPVRSIANCATLVTGRRRVQFAGDQDQRRSDR